MIWMILLGVLIVSKSGFRFFKGLLLIGKWNDVSYAERNEVINKLFPNAYTDENIRLLTVLNFKKFIYAKISITVLVATVFCSIIYSILSK
jgi:hypothetical protein